MDSETTNLDQFARLRAFYSATRQFLAPHRTLKSDSDLLYVSYARVSIDRNLFTMTTRNSHDSPPRLADMTAAPHMPAFHHTDSYALLVSTSHHDATDPFTRTAPLFATNSAICPRRARLDSIVVEHCHRQVLPVPRLPNSFATLALTREQRRRWPNSFLPLPSVIFHLAQPCASTAIRRTRTHIHSYRSRLHN